MKIAIWQAAPAWGAMMDNAESIKQAVLRAKQQGASLFVTSALAFDGAQLGRSMTGRPAFAVGLEAALAKVTAIEGITLVLGHRATDNAAQMHAASVWRDGKCLGQIFAPLYENQQAMPSAEIALAFEDKDGRFGVTLSAPTEAALSTWLNEARPDALIHLNAAFFDGDLPQVYPTLWQQALAGHDCALLSVNLVGLIEENFYFGASFALHGDQTLAYRGAWCAADELCLDFDGKHFQAALKPWPACQEEAWFEVMVAALRDYCHRNHLSRLCLGLSGGLDSALVLTIACEALGNDACEVLMMPGRYTAALSNDAARQMAECLGVRHSVMSIVAAEDAFHQTWAHRFAGLPADVTEENIQARIRGSLLMALSNKTQALLLATGNKSEAAVGYSTLYGDMCGGFEPLKDLYKTDAYRVARWLNQQRGEVIPEAIIQRAPSAELRENQQDNDSLPDYEVLDAIIERYIGEKARAEALIEAGFAPEAVEKTIRLLRRAEFKRRQGATGVRLSKTALGLDWCYPLGEAYTE